MRKFINILRFKPCYKWTSFNTENDKTTRIINRKF